MVVARKPVYFVFGFTMALLTVTNGSKQGVGRTHPKPEFVFLMACRFVDQAVIRVCRVDLLYRMHNAQQRAGQQHVKDEEQHHAENHRRGNDRGEGDDGPTQPHMRCR